MTATAGKYAVQVGERMRQVRQERGMTLRNIQDASCGRFRAVTVGVWERGEHGVTMTRLADYAEWLGVSVRLFLPPDPGERKWRQSIASDAAARALRSVTDTVTTITPDEASDLLMTALKDREAS